MASISDLGLHVTWLGMRLLRTDVRLVGAFELTHGLIPIDTPTDKVRKTKFNLTVPQLTVYQQADLFLGDGESPEIGNMVNPQTFSEFAKRVAQTIEHGTQS